MNKSNRATRRYPNCGISPRGIAVLVVAMAWPLAPLVAAVPGTVDLLPTPPELTTTVAPNVLVTMDDSGSMGRHYMPDARPYTGAGWGVRDDQNNVHNNRYNYANIPWVCAAVIDPRVTDPTDPRSFSMNGVYYNPNIEYKLPLYADGVTSFPTPSFFNAWNNGITRNRPVNPLAIDTIVDPNTTAAVGTRNLSTARFCTSTATNEGAGYYRLRSNVTLTLNALGQISNTGTLYTAGNWEWVPLPAAERTNFAIWWSYYHTRALTATSAMSLAFAAFDQNVRVTWQNLNTNAIATATSIFKFEDLPENSNVRSRFYDWLFTVPVGGGTPTLTATSRAGTFFTRTGANDRNPYWDRDLGRELSCRQNFHFNVSDGFWNQTRPGLPNPHDRQGGYVLPDGVVYSMSDLENQAMRNELGSATDATLADIAFSFWARNLRPDFNNDVATAFKVPPFLPDRSTSVFGPPLAAGQSPLSHKEIYWNPANNPATWSHMVNFMVSFGVDGTIPQTANNYQRIRTGAQPWPETINNNVVNIDDMWHASVNSRGRFFTASDPNTLITSLQEIVASILARRAGGTATSVSIPLLTSSTVGYTAGFDTSDWSGFLTKDRLDSATGQSTGTDWDAGCILTGGFCSTTGGINVGPGMDPNRRRIFTSNHAPNTGAPFRWDELTARQRERLNVNPASVRVDLGTWTVDDFGERRVAYLRGDRTYESTTSPRFRQRSSLLGSVIRGQPVYVSSPISGHGDRWPEGSPEVDCGLDPDSETGCYEQYQRDQRARRPMVYVGSNNGMLHAFDAQSGREAMAFIPNTVIENFRLVRMTQFEGGLIPGVDEKPVQYDAFLNGGWKTVLVGGMRLGGRGVYALDVTEPPVVDSGETEADLAKTRFMWEFANTVPNPGGDAGVDCQPGARFCSSLGYTYDSVNTARIRSGHRWVALISSGYFPQDSLDPASNEVKAGQTSLMVVDLATGRLIRELPTSLAPQTPLETFGLSQAIVYDYGNDQVADVAFAGDLAGNLWRFDLSSENPGNWKVDLMFRTYGDGGAANVGDQPIAYAPVVLQTSSDARPDTPTVPIVVFGTGKFIGAPDRVSTIPQQSFYGVVDYGSCGQDGSGPACGLYPIRANQLNQSNLTQDGQRVRRIAPGAAATALPVSGWRLRLNVSVEPGERAFGIPFPFYFANAAMLRTLIPRGADPCDPGARYALMLVNGKNGVSLLDGDEFVNSPLRYIAGGVVSSPRPLSDPLATPGGGPDSIKIVGLPENLAAPIRQALSAAFAAVDDYWHRGSWRELLDDR